MCEVDSLVSQFMMQSSFWGNSFGLPGDPFMNFGNGSFPSSNGLTLAELKGTVYENFVIYSKNDINLQLLKQFEYGTEARITPSGRTQTIYICKHDGCGKEFLRTCNLLDHMRMHSGIKPNVCEYCGKGFTQK